MSPAEHEADLAFLESKWGLYVGMLTEGELAAFDRLVSAGLAYRCYNNPGGMLGLAKAQKR